MTEKGSFNYVYKGVFFSCMADCRGCYQQGRR